MSQIPRSAWKVIAGTVVTAALLVPLLVLGGPAFARTGAAASEYEYSGSSQYQYRVQICHRTHSKKHPWLLITVSSAAVQAHLRHGDTLPPCSTTPAPTATHGHGNGNGAPGNSGSHGHGKH